MAPSLGLVVVSEFLGTAMFLTLGFFFNYQLVLRCARVSLRPWNFVLLAEFCVRLLGGWMVAGAMGMWAAVPSGAHINPLVTALKAASGRTSEKRAPYYFLGQFLGVISGFVFIYYLFYHPAHALLRTPNETMHPTALPSFLTIIMFASHSFVFERPHPVRYAFQLLASTTILAAIFRLSYMAVWFPLIFMTLISAEQSDPGFKKIIKELERLSAEPTLASIPASTEPEACPHVPRDYSDLPVLKIRCALGAARQARIQRCARELSLEASSKHAADMGWVV
ncbi:hypothetical protein BOTBODRAFT_185885 [Botryobasidium botryosum FD-172 SS1]|uniref:Aquaporin n=1 Tax=Botryobasidium botryosum (strain FD-172 SS1) TaxID=930990 RepID=A0A067MT14_BOTB1|nr:hypothetical protein BOTBODRAFT_185885 [Botryobasidium botryosum FD-172 SS1]